MTQKIPVPNNEILRLVDLFRTGLKDSVNKWFEEANLCTEEELKVFEVVLNRIGDLWEKEEIPLTSVYVASKIAEELAKTRLRPEIEGKSPKGTIVMGTVSEDTHSLGKNIVKRFLSPFFEVHDLGNDVRLEDFIHHAKRTEADIIAVSALMMNSIQQLPHLRDLVEQTEWTQKPKILVGGAPFSINPELCEKVGADDCSGFAFDTVEKAMILLGDSR